MPGPGEAQGVKSHTLRYVGGMSVEQGITAMCASDTGLIIATRSPPGLKRVLYPVLGFEHHPAIRNSIYMSRSSPNNTAASSSVALDQSSWRPSLATVLDANNSATSDSQPSVQAVEDQGFARAQDIKFLKRFGTEIGENGWSGVRLREIGWEPISGLAWLVTITGRVYVTRPGPIDGVNLFFISFIVICKGC